jgi:hypothetical protein
MSDTASWEDAEKPNTGPSVSSSAVKLELIDLHWNSILVRGYATKPWEDPEGSWLILKCVPFENLFIPSGQPRDIAQY